MATATNFEFDYQTDETQVSYRRNKAPSSRRSRRPSYSRSGRTGGVVHSGFHRRRAKRWSW